MIMSLCVEPPSFLLQLAASLIECLLNQHSLAAAAVAKRHVNWRFSRRFLPRYAALSHLSPMSPQSRRLAHPALCPLSRRPRLRYCGIISWRAKNLNARRLGQGRQALNLSRSNCHSIPPSAADLGKKSHSVIVAARNWGPRPELRRRRTLVRILRPRVLRPSLPPSRPRGIFKTRASRSLARRLQWGRFFSPSDRSHWVQPITIGR